MGTQFRRERSERCLRERARHFRRFAKASPTLRRNSSETGPIASERQRTPFARVSRRGEAAANPELSQPVVFS